MKFASFAAASIAVAALNAPAMAQTAAPAAPAAPSAPAAPTAAAFTVDMPIEVLMADERAKAVVDAHLPGIDQHPAYEQFKTMSLTAVAPFSQGMISEEALAKIAADLAAIK